MAYLKIEEICTPSPTGGQLRGTTERTIEDTHASLNHRNLLETSRCLRMSGKPLGGGLPVIKSQITHPDQNLIQQHIQQGLK